MAGSERGRPDVSEADRMREALRRGLAGPLPGREAQRAAWPDGLPQRDDLPPGIEYGPAAVLIALFEAEDGSGGDLGAERRGTARPVHAAAAPSLPSPRFGFP